MRHVLNFGDAGESLWQQTPDGSFDKLFCIKDAQGGNLLKDLVPTLKGQDLPHLYENLVEIPDLDGGCEEYWLERTGLAYIPEGFIPRDKATPEMLDAFGLIQPENTTQEAFKPETSQENYVEDLNLSTESSREPNEPKDTVDVFMEMVHNRGQKVYELGTIETRQEEIKRKFEEEMNELEDRKQVVLEVIDTFDLCLRSFMKDKIGE